MRQHYRPRGERGGVCLTINLVIICRYALTAVHSAWAAFNQELEIDRLLLLQNYRSGCGDGGPGEAAAHHGRGRSQVPLAVRSVQGALRHPASPQAGALETPEPTRGPPAACASCSPAGSILCSDRAACPAAHECTQVPDVRRWSLMRACVRTSMYVSR